MSIGFGANAGMGVSGSTGGVINISKGAKINLTKDTPGLKKIMFGLGWKINDRYDSGDDYDLDASVFLCGENNRSKQEWFIFYNNLEGPNKCVVHMGDNRVGGDGDNDDEQIYVDLSLVPDEVSKIAIVVTIDQAERRRQNFGAVESAYCRLVDNETGNEVVRYDLGEDFSVETAVIVGEVYRHNGDWKFNAMGRGLKNGLIGLCSYYGLQAEYR